ncbi:MAG: glycosyltransferase family 2 protein [Acidobacteria bacterium]|nr:glycosyltransferase family 2 protein [Acidobacteriota bacterium]
MKISVVIPTHNRSDALAKTLANLAKQKFAENWEVIVINNGSTDDTDDVVLRQSFPVKLRLLHEAKLGVAAARNAGAEAAGGEYLSFLDNDILVEPDYLDRQYTALRANPGCWAMGQVINLPEQERTPFGQYRKSLYGFIPPGSDIQEASWMTGQVVSLPKADFVQLGGFDENFGGASVEDFDLAIRAWELGIKILFFPSIVAVHNDWAGFSIRDYCRRQRLYSQQEPLFWLKYGEKHPRLNLVRENLPPFLKHDSSLLLLRKQMKRFLATGLAQKVLFDLCDLLEQFQLPTPILWRIYRVVLSTSIYVGFQEGLAAYSMDDIASRFEPLISNKHH